MHRNSSGCILRFLHFFILDFCGEICGLLGWSRYDNPRRNICRWKSELPYYDLKSFMLCWRKTWTYSQLPIFSHGWHVYTQTCSHISRKFCILWAKRATLLHEWAKRTTVLNEWAKRTSDCTVFTEFSKYIKNTE